MMKNIAYIVLFLVSSVLNSQIYRGTVIDKDSRKKVDFANVGIIGKNTGTVSAEDGSFMMKIDSSVEKKDVIRISKIGYESMQFPISEFRNSQIFEIEKKVNRLSEVRIKPKIFKEKLLGNVFKAKTISAGFSNNILGNEIGVLMKVKKTSYLKEVKINISKCLYDTVYFRLNIAEVGMDHSYKNILQEPIYLILPKDSVKETIIIDLRENDIVTNGDFIVSLEYIKDLGKGGLFFCGALFHKSYTKSTSHSEWKTAPVGISIGVLADVEQ